MFDVVGVSTALVFCYLTFWKILRIHANAKIQQREVSFPYPSPASIVFLFSFSRGGEELLFLDFVISITLTFSPRFPPGVACSTTFSHVRWLRWVRRCVMLLTRICNIFQPGFLSSKIDYSWKEINYLPEKKLIQRGAIGF